MTNFTIYSKSTGMILRNVDCPDDMLIFQVSDGESAIMEYSIDNIHYAPNGIVIFRPLFNIAISKYVVKADGMDNTRISEIPSGASIYIRGPISTSEVADGTDLVMTFLKVGIYEIVISMFPYIDFKGEINAT